MDRTATLEKMIAIRDSIDGLWSREGNDDIAYALHDALESIERAIRMARENWSEESE